MTEHEKIKYIHKNGGSSLKDFPPEEITLDMCWAAVEKDVTAIAFAPEPYRRKLIDWCIEKRVSIFTRLSDEEKTAENCKHAVGLDGMMLQFVPPQLLSDDLIRKAVSNKPQAIQFIPESMLTPAYVASLVFYNPDCIRYLPVSLKTREFYTALAEEKPDLFMYIPKKYHTAALCKLVISKKGFASIGDAVEADPSLFFELPPSLYDHDSSMAFVQAGCLDFRPGHGVSDTTLYYQGNTIDLTKVLKYPDVCEEAVKRNRYTIRIVPDEMITPDFCYAAIQADPEAFGLIPKKYRTPDLCELAVQLNACNLEYIPDAICTDEMRNRFTQVLDKEPLVVSLSKVPPKWRTLEMCKSALLSGTGTPDDIPSELFDKEFALWIISNVNPWTEGHGYLNRIPKQLRDKEVCMAAVQRAGGDLCDVPEELKTHEMCLAAARQSPKAVRYIPKDRFTPDIVLAIAEKGMWVNFMEIPADKLTAEACKAFFRNWKGTSLVCAPLKAIPKALFDQELFDLAMKAIPQDFEDVPASYITEDMVLSVARTMPLALQMNENLPARFLEEDCLLKISNVMPPDADRASILCSLRRKRDSINAE